VFVVPTADGVRLPGSQFDERGCPGVVTDSYELPDNSAK
jgi:hypothetical protein